MKDDETENNSNKAFSIQDNEGYAQDIEGISEHDYADHSHITVYDDRGRLSFDADDDGNITNIHEVSNKDQNTKEQYPDCHINDFHK